MLCGNFIIKDFPVMLYFYFYIKNVGCRLTNSGRYPNIYYRTWYDQIHVWVIKSWFQRFWAQKKNGYSIKITVHKWRRRRDSNPWYPYEVYTISNRARSTNYATSPRVLKKYTIFTWQLCYYKAPREQSQEIFFNLHTIHTILLHRLTEKKGAQFF